LAKTSTRIGFLPTKGAMFRLGLALSRALTGVPPNFGRTAAIGQNFGRSAAIGQNFGVWLVFGGKTRAGLPQRAEASPPLRRRLPVLPAPDASPNRESARRPGVSRWSASWPTFSSTAKTHGLDERGGKKKIFLFQSACRTILAPAGAKRTKSRPSQGSRRR
jgi:hypothetical protein